MHHLQSPLPEKHPRIEVPQLNHRQIRPLRIHRQGHIRFFQFKPLHPRIPLDQLTHVKRHLHPVQRRQQLLMPRVIVESQLARHHVARHPKTQLRKIHINPVLIQLPHQIPLPSRLKRFRVQIQHSPRHPAQDQQNQHTSAKSTHHLSPQPAATSKHLNLNSTNMHLPNKSQIATPPMFA